MKRPLRKGAAALLLLGALGQGLASAAPTPSYSVTCVAGVQTKVDWQRAKLAEVTIRWVAPAGSTIVYEDAVVPVQPHPPRGFIVAATARSKEGIDPVAVVVSFERSGGAGTDQVEVPCT